MNTFIWQSHEYEIPASEPPQNRNMDDLHPAFRPLIESYIKDVSKILTHVELIVTETRRTVERQSWLYAQGRYAPYQNTRVRSWTLWSKHRYGLASDLAMIRRDSGEAIWAEASWAHLLEVCPPEHYGLKNLNPIEWVHFEHVFADEMLKDVTRFNITKS